MGGKIKQSQRTKNNARPSNSGRSAEILQSSGNLSPGLIFGGLKSTSQLFPTLSTPTLDQGLSPEYSICIKRLNKKDPVTKVKALQELNGLVTNGNIDEVLLVLPSWVHFYKILSVDTDCKVREAVQLCHGSVARVCGRQLAPVIKQLAPAWLQAQYDEHGPAAGLARTSLQATFPENKLPEVINFCKEEIMSQILDNIIGKSEKTLPKKSEGPEEGEVRVHRLVGSALRGLRLLVARLPPEQRGWLEGALQPVLSSPAFWKLATHSAAGIRDAWFCSMAQYVQSFGLELSQGIGRRILNAAAKDCQSQRHSWHCLLLIINAVPDWYKWLDKGDIINKRILDLLEKGGWGDSRQLNDVLIPLLSHLPEDQHTKEFYERLFTASFKGLQKKSIMNSKSERRYWITKIFECLKYLSQQSHSFVVEVITAAHRNFLKIILSTQYEDQLKTNLIKHSANCMISLIRFWLTQSEGEHGERYDQLVRNFWQNILSTVLSQLEAPMETDELVLVIGGHVLLLQTLKKDFLSGSKVQSIKFEDDSPVHSEIQNSPTIDEASIKRYEHNLNAVVQTVCGDYFQYADKNNVSDPIFTAVVSVLKEFKSEPVLLALGRHFEANNLYDVFHKVLFKWLLDTTMACDSLIDIVFLLLKHLTREEQTAVLASFDKTSSDVVERCVARAARECSGGGEGQGQGEGEGVVRQWIRGGAPQQALLRRASACAATRRAALLLPYTEELIEPETASQIMEVVCATVRGCLEELLKCKTPEDLEGPKLTAMEESMLQAAQLVQTLPRHLQGNHYQDLMYSLFEFAMLHPGDLEASDPHWWGEVREVMQRDPGLLAPRVARVLARSTEALDLPQIERLASRSLCLFEELTNPEPPEDLTELAGLCELMMGCVVREDVSVDAFALRHDIIVGNLSCHLEDAVVAEVIRHANSERPPLLTVPLLRPFLAHHVFRAALLRALLGRAEKGEGRGERGEERGEKEEEPEPRPWGEALLSNAHFRAELCKLLREHAVLGSLDKAYEFWPHHELIRETRLEVDALLDDIVAETPDRTKNEVLLAVAQRAVRDGFYWAYAAKLYGEKMGEVSVTDTVEELLRDPVSAIHCLQVASGTEGESGLRAAQLVVGCSAAAAWPGRCGPLLGPSLGLGPGLGLGLGLGPPDLGPLADFAMTCGRDQMLCERPVADTPWQVAAAEAASLRFAARYLRRHGVRTPRHLWDFANVSLCAVLRNVCTAPHPTTKVAMLMSAACELLSFTAAFVGRPALWWADEPPSPHVASLPDEWRDVFSPPLYTDLWLLILRLLQLPEPAMDVGWAVVVRQAAAALVLAPWAVVERTLLAQGHSVRSVCAAATRVLAGARPRWLQHLAHAVLRQLVAPLRAADVEQMATFGKQADSEGGERERTPELVLNWMQEDIDRSLDLAEAVLVDFTPGVSSFSPEPGSEEYSVCLGGLLLGEVVGLVCDSSPGDLPQHYARWHRETKYAARLVPVALRLLPGELLSHAGTPPSAAAYFPADTADADDEDGVAGGDDKGFERGWREAMFAAAGHALAAGVGGAGSADVRAWCGADVKGGGALRRIVRDRCTPRLLRRALGALARTRSLPENTTVRIQRAAREVVVSLEVDERTISLVLALAGDHPLTPVRARTLPPPSHHQPHQAPDWLALYLSYQNGSIVTAVSMWARAVARAVANIEPCLVCYCTLQPRCGRLPDQRCRQCRRRYHHECLVSWFQASKQTQCPVCRTSF